MGRRRVKGKAKQSKALARSKDNPDKVKFLEPIREEEDVTDAVTPDRAETSGLEREFETLNLETGAESQEGEALQKILKAPEDIYGTRSDYFTPRSNASTVYHSILIQSMLENLCLSSGVDYEIQISKPHWSQVDSNASDASSCDEEEEYSVDRDREYFETLKQRTRDRGGFRFEDFPSLWVGERLAEGGQGEIYEALLYNYTKPKRPIKCVVKVFKGGYPLKALELQWPSGMVCKEDHLRSGPLEYILGATLLNDERFKDRFAFVMRRQWGDLRKLIILRKVRNNNNGPPFQHKEVLNLMNGIARNMHTLHEDHGILHRDVKSSNVLLFSENVANFSVVTTVADFECSAGVVGTGFWRAPEILRQLKNRVESARLELTPKIDVYGYGMTCYEIVTGCLPFEGQNTRDFDLVIEGERPELPSELCPLVRNIITSCWDDDPLKRPSFKEIYEKISCEIDKDPEFYNIFPQRATLSTSCPLFEYEDGFFYFGKSDSYF